MAVSAFRSIPVVIISTLIIACGPQAIDSEETSASDVPTGSIQQASNATCVTSATQDYNFCADLYAKEMTLSYPGFYSFFLAEGKDKCLPKYNLAKQVCNLKSSAVIYRVLDANIHMETTVYETSIFGPVEAKFTFAASPLSDARANKTPIYRCLTNSSSTADWSNDFLSRSSNCEGAGSIISTVGYDYGFAGSSLYVPVYRCRTSVPFAKADHFLSYDFNCEGKVKDFLLGYVLKPL